MEQSTELFNNGFQNYYNMKLPAHKYDQCLKIQKFSFDLITAYYIHIQNDQNVTYTDAQIFILIKKIIWEETLKVLSAATRLGNSQKRKGLVFSHHPKTEEARKKMLH